MSREFLLPCECGEKVVITKVQAGQTLSCQCGRSLEVPTLQRIELLEPAAPVAALRRRPEAGWDRRRGLILLGLVVALVGGLWAGYLELTKPRLLDIQEMSPAVTWSLWQELRLGANRFPTPEAQGFAEYLKQNRDWMIVALVVGAGGLLLTAGAYALMRPTYTSIHPGDRKRPSAEPPATSPSPDGESAPPAH